MMRRGCDTQRHLKSRTGLLHWDCVPARKTQANQGLDLTIPGAAQSVPVGPLCLLSGLAAQAHVRRTTDGPRMREQGIRSVARTRGRRRDVECCSWLLGASGPALGAGHVSRLDRVSAVTARGACSRAYWHHGMPLRTPGRAPSTADVTLVGRSPSSLHCFAAPGQLRPRYLLRTTGPALGSHGQWTSSAGARVPAGASGVSTCTTTVPNHKLLPTSDAKGFRGLFGTLDHGAAGTTHSPCGCGPIRAFRVSAALAAEFDVGLLERV